MAAYLRQKANETKKQNDIEQQVAESNKTYKTREISTERSLQPTGEHGAFRARLLKNPTVIDTLDSVHRSLLFNNLRFEPDARQHLDTRIPSNGSNASITTNEQAKNAEQLLELTAATSKLPVLAQHVVRCYGKVNIAPTLTWSEERLREDGALLAPEEEDSLEDWNNNIDGKSQESSKVKMTVQQIQRVKETAFNDLTSSARTQEPNEAGRVFPTHPPEHRGTSSLFDVETSDFESASVTSGSNSAVDGGWRSVRTSSAFSEGSRDVANINRFNLGSTSETPPAGPVNSGCNLRDEQGSHKTMITININYRCDTNPLRMSQGVTDAPGDATNKTVDIVMSTPAPAQVDDFKTCATGARKSSSTTGDTFGPGDTRQLKKTAHTKTNEPMDLQKEQAQSCSGVYEVNSLAIRKEQRGSDSSTQMKTDNHVKQRLSSVATNRSYQSPEHEDYYDCDELYDSTLSLYQQATSEPVTPQDLDEKLRFAGENYASTSSCDDSIVFLNNASEQQMIRIVQELSEDLGVVTSTVMMNKAQIKEMQRMNGSVDKGEEVVDYRDEKLEKRRKPRGSGDGSSKKRHDKMNLHRQQRVIDDNFCNEILDSTIYFDRLHGIRRGQSAGGNEVASMSPSPTHARFVECLSDSIVYDIVTPGVSSFDSGMSVGKLEGKPRFSGKTMGRLMMKRLEKLQQTTTQGGEGLGRAQKLNLSDASTSSSQALHVSGPKKPPRTFADSPKRTALSTGQMPPSCPMRKNLDDSNDHSHNGIGWKAETVKLKSPQVGWAIPADEAANGKNLSISDQVYSMLHYSEDERSKRLIQMGNSDPAPQQYSALKTTAHKHPYRGVCSGDLLGSKLDIDTVDGATTSSPRRHSSSTDFDRFVMESNVKSTPNRRREHQHYSRDEGGAAKGGGGSNSSSTRRLIKQYLNEERQTNAAHRKGPAAHASGRRRRTTGGIFERRQKQQENFLDDVRRSNHEPRRKKPKEPASQSPQPRGETAANDCCPIAGHRTDTTVRNNNNNNCGHSGATVGGMVTKRRTFRKQALLKRTRTLFEASKKKIWSIKKIETPKKMNTVSSSATPSRANVHDPNINRNSSTKKKQNLHHKHLGYTPDHLRCKSCQPRPSGRMVQEEDVETKVIDQGQMEEAIVPRIHCTTQHTVLHPEENNEGNTAGGMLSVQTDRKSARSLNFAAAVQSSSSVLAHHAKEGEQMSPRKSGMQLLNETKFLKTLRNLKIPPKRIFRFASQSSSPTGSERSTMAYRENHVQGEFQSFDDLNLDSVAHMGDFLCNIRRMVDGGGTEQSQRYGRRSFEENQAEEPIYQEISPKGNKTMLNEFISTETNKRYLMVNNNPNILYATVSKVKNEALERPGFLVKARSLTTVALGVAADPSVTSTQVSKQQNNTCKSQRKSYNHRAGIYFPLHDDDFVDDREGVDDDSDQCQARGNVEPESICHCPARHYPDRVGPSSSTSKAPSGSSIRRSLFNEDSSHPSSRERTGYSFLSTDESDVSVLQVEDNVDSDTQGRARVQQEREVGIVVTEPSIVRERVEDRFASGAIVRREHDRFHQQPVSTSEGTTVAQRTNGDEDGATCEDLNQFSFEKDIVVEVRKETARRNDKKDIIATNGQAYPGTKGEPELTALKKINNVETTPLGCFDADSEIESLRRYEDREIEELVVTLHDTVTISDMGSLETASSVANIDTIGYDTIDLAPPVARLFRCVQEKYDHRNLTVDTVDVSELISQQGEGDTFVTSNDSSIKDSPSSGNKHKFSSGVGSTVIRNLKDKLRSSFRKSKSFIKNERQRFASYLLEERSAHSNTSTTTTPPSSYSSSSSSSPRVWSSAKKVPQNQLAPIATSEDVQTASGAYRSFDDGSGAMFSTDSMTELSSQYKFDLTLQIKRQADARKQLKQALAICRTTREFECSPELVEAERLLLLATLKETAARNELSRIDYAANGMTLVKRKRVGGVALNHFEFPLKDTAISDSLFNYFYVVVCTYKDQVQGTVATERRSDGRVHFRDCEIKYHDLDADYEIRVEVFVLRLRKNMKNYSFESRYHLEKRNTEKRPLGCPSPSKKLREAGRMLSFRSGSRKPLDLDNEFSRFKSQGFLTLTSFALLTSNGAEAAESGRTTFDTTYTTAQPECRSFSQATTSFSMLEGGEVSAHSPYYSVSSNFQHLIRRQGNDNVFLVEDFKYLTLDSMAYTSNMAGTIGMTVNSEVRFEGSDVCGFLDVGEKGDDSDGISWNRRWCKVNGFALEFWNYPQDCHEKKPIQCIDLVRCVNERIELAERSICSRPRTVKVDIFHGSKVTITGASCNSSGIGSYKSTGVTTSPHFVEEAQSTASGRECLRVMSPTSSRSQNNNVMCFLLAADTQADLKRWLNELNRVVKFLKEWKI